MKKNVYFFLLYLSILIVGCKKDEAIVVVSGNTAPPDHTIPSIVKENYINKVYISVLGRKPETAEIASGLSLIDQHNLSAADRNEFLDEVFSKSGYNQRIYEIASIKILNSFDTIAVNDQINLYKLLLTQPQYAPFYDLINMELDRLYDLKAIPTDLNNNALTPIGMHRRLMNNYFYDQINMGTENFVVSSFQNFMDRYPTNNELAEGKKMVDGLSAILFFTTGTTKDNYMDIILDTDNYFESQVRELFVRYLFRQPTSVEMTDYASDYKTDRDYKKLQKAILSLDEYVGIN